MPRCAMWDRLNLNLSAFLVVPGSSNFSTVPVLTAGFRRFRFKLALRTSGAPSNIDVAVITQTFSRTFFLQTSVLAGVAVAGVFTPVVAQWGEGLAVAVPVDCEDGMYISVGFVNNFGNNCQCTAAELWAQD